MATYTVIRVRKEWAADGTHHHLEGVCTDAGVHYTRRKVVNSINAGNIWRTSVNGYSTTITPLTYCPQANCYATPYIRTNPDPTELDNLENLPLC